MPMKTTHLLLTLSLCMLGFGCQSGYEYKWKATTTGLELFHHDHKVGALLKADVTEDITFTDKIERIDDSFFKISRTFTVSKAIDSARFITAFEVYSASHYAIIPSVNYNGNNWGRGNEPKGFKKDDQWWTVSYRATPVPGATYSEGDRYAVALWGENPVSHKDAFSCSIQPEAQQTTHCLIYPEEEMPLCYIARDRYGDGFRRKMRLEKGDTKTVVAYLLVSEVKPQHRALQPFLQKAWQMSKHEKPTIFEPEKIWQLAICYAKESLWAEEGSFKGFSIGLLPDNKRGWQQRAGWKYEIGWCGQNASFGNSMLTDYLKTGDEGSLEMGLTCLDTWANNAALPNGLFITNYDYILEKRADATVDACNLGAAALNYFEASDLAKQCKKERPAYEKIALGICRFVKDDQQASGVYGRGWKYDGECVFREGTVGCFLVSPMIEAYRRTQDKSYLESAVSAYNHYLKQLNEDGYTTAGALDTWCIDKESAIALLRAALKLYHITRDARYLDDAVQVSYYLSTWLWHYDGVYAPDDDFTRYGYKTFGGTAVSTQHRHLDPYALLWVSEWIELSLLTKDPQWKEKALAIWHNGCQLISDGSLEIHGMLRPVGSQNEAYFQCNWNFTAQKERINQWLVAWPGAFRLETLRRLSDWNILKEDLTKTDLMEQVVWTEWIPRKELAPVFRRVGNKLSISTGGSKEAIGKWISNKIAVSDSYDLVFDASYTAQKIRDEEKNIFSMLSFYNAKGVLLQRDYVPVHSATKKISRQLDLPKNTASVIIELGLKNCPQATVVFDNIKLNMVEKRPPRTVKIATTYMMPRESLQKNLDLMINVIDKAGKENPDVILLSENVYESRTGLTPEEVCQPVPGFLTDKIGEYAKKYNAYIIWTMNEKEGDIIYNTAVIIGRDGKVCGKYRKTHLPLTEVESGISQGDTYEVFDLDFGRVGILICYDQMFPENAGILSRMGAEIIFIPTQGEDKIFQQALARANGIYVVVSGYWGGASSRIIDPLGEIVNFVPDEAAGYVVEQIDLNKRFFIYWMSIGPGNGEIKVLFDRERRPEIYK